MALTPRLDDFASQAAAKTWAEYAVHSLFSLTTEYVVHTACNCDDCQPETSFHAARVGGVRMSNMLKLA